MTKTSSIHDKRIFGLDLYRAVAILLVVMSHGAMLTGPIFDWVPTVLLPDGVELFFVLSGFLIGTILIETIEQEDRITFKVLSNFWKRRWFRTLPNYYLILGVNVALVSGGVIHGDINQFNWKYLFFLQNFNEGFHSFFWESWSLSVEEWFYLILPVVLVLGRLIFRKKDAILFAIMILIVAPLLYRVSVSREVYDDFWFGVEVRKVVLLRLDTIIYGVLAAYVAYYHPNFWRRSRYVSLVLGIGFMAAALWIPHPVESFYTRVFFFAVMSLGAMFFLPAAHAWRIEKVNALSRSVVFISRISYAMYLVNLALVAQVILKNFPPETTAEHWLAFFVFWGATVGISTLIYYFYERPLMKLRDRI